METVCDLVLFVMSDPHPTAFWKTWAECTQVSFGETNCGFSEIPAIAKKPISGFAKCGPSPLSADHAKAILVRTANFADIRIICTFLTNIIREKAKSEPSYTIYTSDVFGAGFWGLTKKDSLPVRTTLIWCSLVFILVVFLTWTRNESKGVVFKAKMCYWRKK